MSRKGTPLQVPSDANVRELLEHDEDWLCRLSTKELNDLVKQENLPARVIDELKKKRRIVKGRKSFKNRKWVCFCHISLLYAILKSSSKLFFMGVLACQRMFLFKF